MTCPTITAPRSRLLPVCGRIAKCAFSRECWLTPPLASLLTSTGTRCTLRQCSSSYKMDMFRHHWYSSKAYETQSRNRHRARSNVLLSIDRIIWILRIIRTNRRQTFTAIQQGPTPTRLSVSYGRVCRVAGLSVRMRILSPTRQVQQEQERRRET